MLIPACTFKRVCITGSYKALRFGVRALGVYALGYRDLGSGV